MTEWIPARRTRQAIVIAIIAIVSVFTLQKVMGGTAAEQAARDFLLSHNEVERRLGPNLSIGNMGLPQRCNLGSTPGEMFANYRLRVSGEQGSADATIKLRREIQEDEWRVYEATLWTSEGAVTLR